MKTISTQPAKATCSIITVSITLIIAIIFLSSCTASASSRHHNFVPGSSKSIEYHYFPDADVHYDSTRRVYHYSPYDSAAGKALKNYRTPYTLTNTVDTLCVQSSASHGKTSISRKSIAVISTELRRL